MESIAVHFPLSMTQKTHGDFEDPVSFLALIKSWLSTNAGHRHVEEA